MSQLDQENPELFETRDHSGGSYSGDSKENESVLLGAVKRYLEDLEAGRNPDREAVLRQYPELADELRIHLEGIEFLHRVAPQMLEPGGGEPVSLAVRELGDFRILRQIGRGGMGVVYEAEQLSLGRRVALKVLPFAALLDLRQLQRFKNEAHAAAMLRHPHIVTAYGTGCERGVHYLAMELIEGEPLSDIIAHLRAGQGPADAESSAADGCAETEPVASLSTQYSSDRRAFYRSVVHLALPIAEALDYAHAEGIVHRDIKPSNLLIDKKGKPWLTDLGLAQFQSEQNLTLTGDLLGTVRYMSPEQASGQRFLDRRTDVYSLGITLYELLLLRPAFSENNRHQLLKQILDCQPPFPRAIAPDMPRDLETILLKSTAKDPRARYVSAGELAEDLRRFLDQKPISARRSGRIEHAWRWARRNRAMACLIAAVWILLSILAIAGPLVAWKQAALAEKEIATRNSAEHHRRRLQEILNGVLVAKGDSATDTPRTQEELQHELAAQALAYYEELLEQRGADPEIRLQTGMAYRQLARLKKLSDQPHQTADLCTKAIAILTPLVDDFPTDQRARYELCRVLRTFGNHLTYDLKDPQSGIKCHQKATLLAKRLVQDAPHHAPYRLQLTACRGFLAHALFYCGRIAESESHLQAAVDAESRYLEETGTKVNTVGMLAWTTSVLGRSYLNTSRFEQAERELRKADDLFALWPDAYLHGRAERMGALGQHRLTSGQLYCAIRRPEHALQSFRDAISLSDQLLQRFAPFNWGRHIRVAAKEGLSDVLLAVGQTKDAEQILQSALLDRQQLAETAGALGGVRADLAWCEIRMGQLLWWSGRHRDASKTFQTARNRLEQLVIVHPGIRAYQVPLAVLLTTCPDDRLRNPGRAVELAEAALHREGGASWQLLGVAHYRAGDLESAIEALQRSLEIWQGGEAFNWAFLAMSHWRLGNEQEARQWLKKLNDAVENHSPIQLTNFTHPRCLDDLHRESVTLFSAQASADVNAVILQSER